MGGIESRPPSHRSKRTVSESSKRMRTSDQDNRVTGAEDAARDFEQDFEKYRPLLFSIAYRMLGSAMEAEDMVQEAFLRYQRVNAAEVESPKAYLTTIITRLCLDQLKSARAQREQYVGIWLPEPLVTHDGTDFAGIELPGTAYARRESISLAFLHVLERLSPVERAVFLLREVFDYPYSDIARMIGKREDNCRRYYHNAKRDLMAHRPRFEASTEGHRALIERFVKAVSTGDIDVLTELLAEDVQLVSDGGGKAPASPQPVYGRTMALRLYRNLGRFIPEDGQVLITEINGSPALVLRDTHRILAVVTFTIIEGRIQLVHNLFNPDKLQKIEPSLADAEAIAFDDSPSA